MFGFLATPLLNEIKSLGAFGGIVASLIVGAGWLLPGLRTMRKPHTGATT
ncbi:MAG: hypothetical protein V4475_08655 [Pseudomonadota bacterium]